MSLNQIEIVREGKSATILLNRPEARNALNPAMIESLIKAVNIVVSDREIRVVVIRSKNGTFSAGADLKWLKDSGSKTFEQNRSDSALISLLMKTLHEVPVPLISVTKGAVMGGALGILGCSDWVLSDPDTRFAFSEVRLGLAPAIIMPYVLRRTDSIKIKQMMLTGRTFDAWEALDAGLTDQVGEEAEISQGLDQLVQTLSELPGNAVREIKRLWSVSQPFLDPDIQEKCIDSLTSLKQSTEAQELILKFFNKK